MSCGRFLGEVRGEAGKRVDKSWWVAGNATTEPRFTNRGVFCGRCGGRALIERVDKVYVG
jgi:hypothetical protein